MTETDHHTMLVVQLVDELGDRARALARVLDPDADLGLAERVEEVAPVLADQLCGEDERLAAQTVIDLAPVLWPHGGPDEWDPAWWRTPLGRQFARSLHHESTDAITYAHAALMLGLVRGTVCTMVHRGTLDRHPDGGVVLGSVLERLARPMQ